jgi:RNA polymerase sigma-70 factor (ECF subfamily)
LKKSKRRPSTVPIDIESLKFKDDFDENEIKKIKILYEHINQLNLLEKGIILLYLEGKSQEEIASITALSKTNVGTKLSRIKEKLKLQINKNI